MRALKKFSKSEQLRVALATLLIGVGAGVAATLLHDFSSMLTKAIGSNKSFTFYTFFGALLFAALSYYLTKLVFNDTNGSGIPQVKLALVAYRGKLPKRMPVGKFLTTVLTLGTGLSFGKEGPMVTISASWAHFVSHYLKLNRQLMKVMVASGAAAGLAAAFNTPIAAVIFTIEEILGELRTKYLGPIIVTSVVASVTSFKLLNHHATFLPIHYQFHIEWHLIFYFLLGALAAVLGSLLTKSILAFKELKKKTCESKGFIFVIGVIILAALASHYDPVVLGDGVAFMNQLLSGKINLGLSSLLIILVIKGVLVASAYSSGLSGGIFMPVLFLGALGGSAFGSVLTLAGVEHIEIGAFALMGMTSLLVSVIRTPFTAFVLLFEMTHDYELILPLMVSSITAYWIAEAISPYSVYEEVAEYEGVHLPNQKDSEYLTELSVEDCMIRDVFTLRGSITVEEAMKQIEGKPFSGFPIVFKEQLYGVINLYELRTQFKKDPTVKLHEITKYNAIYVYPDQNLLVAMDKMKRFNISRLPVVTRFNNRHLVGLITPYEVVEHLGLSKNNPKID